MTIDDESFLSAYLDGQLGPDQQQLVESALVSDPQLVEELRSLRMVRDLVAGLSRESSVDVTARVLVRLFGRSRWRPVLGPASVRALVVRHRALAAGLVGVAAALLIALSLAFIRQRHVPPGPGPAAPRVTSLETYISPSTAGLLNVSESRWPSFAIGSTSAGAASQPETSSGPSDDDLRAFKGPGELEHVRQYLDNPSLRRIFLVGDVLDEPGQRQVASVIEETTRFNYYKIVIERGIVIDPRHPDEATVFAVVVNPDELKTLRQGLRAALHDRVEEAPVDPTVVTQLADIGHVQACPPAPVAEVMIPRDPALAMRAPEAVGERPTPPPDQAAPSQPTPEQERSSPAADLPGPARKPDQDFVVLVWVSRARPG